MSTPMSAGTWPSCRAISKSTPTPDPPSLAPSMGSRWRRLSLSANGRVSQWAKSNTRSRDSGWKDPTMFFMLRMVPSNALARPSCTVTWAPWRANSLANQSAHASCVSVLGTRGPKATCVATYAYAESSLNSGATTSSAGGVSGFREAPDPASVPHAAKASRANPANQGVAKVNLPTAPAASVFVILDGDALRGEDVADFVRGSPVLVRFGLGAHVHQQVQQRPCVVSFSL